MVLISKNGDLIDAARYVLYMVKNCSTLVTCEAITAAKVQLNLSVFRNFSTDYGNINYWSVTILLRI